jgi:hypothetical protein
MRLKSAKLACVAISLPIFGFSASAAANSMDVQTLVNLCKADKNSVQWGYCVGYIVGVAKKMADFGIQRQPYGDGTTPRPREALCPDGAKDFDATVMVPIFINWVEHHPEQLSSLASHAVGYALQGRRPCNFSRVLTKDR